MQTANSPWHHRFDDSGLLTSPGGELKLRAAYLADKALHSMLRIQRAHKVAQGVKPAPRCRRLIGGTLFVHIEWGTQEVALRAVEGQIVGHGSCSTCYHVYDPATRRIMEGRNMIFLQTPCITPAGERQLPTHPPLPSDEEPGDSKGNNYTPDDAFIRDHRNHTYVSAQPAYVSADHATAIGGFLDPQVSARL